ncbi:HNH endonuclease signature motif containing protein [Mesorhizobium sp. AD1-1]|uniref:HNH endonuclease signature motif containing protein n=1 Tax=Mesorhizobium sp. AD1-1 TaxID=2876621 RepID=UPI001CCD31CE|nr:HNH endonuclease signature motif containing protein [Mesorhizobium sp. AD1-1]
MSEQLKLALSRDRGDAPYDLTDDECAAVVVRYGEYDAAQGRGSDNLAAPSVSEELSNAIRDAYNHVQIRGRLERLRETLKSGARLCPYCSAPTITDLDHYLPRSIYKDLAIYPRNLIPSCHPCNNIKRAFVSDEESDQLVHPYLDQLPPINFLRADIVTSADGGLSVLFGITDELDPNNEMLEKAEFQMEKFQLNSRLKTSINVFLAGYEEAFDLAFGGGGAALSSFLARTSDALARNFGRNDWRVALLRSLVSNHEFCNGGYKRALGTLEFGDGLA